MMALILGTVAAGMYLVRKLDPWTYAKITMKGRLGMLAGCTISSLLLRYMAGEDMLAEKLSLAVILGCLLLACMTDMITFQVHNFVWWISGLAALALLWQGGQKGYALQNLLELIFFCGLQMIVFVRMYGRADGYAFCVCAVAETGFGMGLKGFLMHMLLAFCLLLAIQASRKNINRKGNLKEPVPFLPYIAVSFYLVLLIK